MGVRGDNLYLLCTPFFKTLLHTALMGRSTQRFAATVYLKAWYFVLQGRRCLSGQAETPSGDSRGPVLDLFNPTPEHKQLRDMVRSFAEREVDPQALAFNREEKVSSSPSSTAARVQGNPSPFMDSQHTPPVMPASSICRFSRSWASWAFLD